MQLWSRRDTHTMSSVGTAELGINLLDLLALACPILTLVKLYPAYSPGAHLLITGSILIAAGIVLLPPRPLAWPPPDDDGRGPLRGLARALRSPRFWIRAAAVIGVVVLTIASAQVYCALAPPTRAFSASLSHPSGSGPDLTAHTSDLGAWAAEFKHSQFIDYIVTAVGPIALSVPEKDEKDEKDSRKSVIPADGPGRLTTLVITLLDPVDGAPHWSLELTNLVGRSTDHAQRPSFPNKNNPASGSAVTDPDGTLLAIHLDSTWNESANQWVTPIAIINLTSGKAIGSAEIQGEIPGTVLTSDTLAVQVADGSALEPGGTILTYSSARVVELGEFAGPDPWSSRSFIALRRGSERAERDRESGRELVIATLFDPSTGTAPIPAPGAPPSSTACADLRPGACCARPNRAAPHAPSARPEPSR
ncbi:hypothetical protein OHJ16_06490 [Actinomyces israelii]|uniref:Uncharacterized protein n=1 Tax=Actinomyces israelii TaxID=1659 RepID=A0ABT4I8L4_9ACTO|nr:hypothetical protein [Actinomyces israelii]MCZ0857689.1 hypothetical protein [Actinomyces israelii]